MDDCAKPLLRNNRAWKAPGIQVELAHPYNVEHLLAEKLARSLVYRLSVGSSHFPFPKIRCGNSPFLIKRDGQYLHLIVSQLALVEFRGYGALHIVLAASLHYHSLLAAKVAQMPVNRLYRAE